MLLLPLPRPLYGCHAHGGRRRLGGGSGAGPASAVRRRRPAAARAGGSHHGGQQHALLQQLLCARLQLDAAEAAAYAAAAAAAAAATASSSGGGAHDEQQQESEQEAQAAAAAQRALDALSSVLPDAASVRAILRREPRLLTSGGVAGLLDFLSSYGFSAGHQRSLLLQAPGVFADGDAAAAGAAILRLKRRWGLRNDEVAPFVVSVPQVLGMREARDVDMVVSLWSKFRVGVDERGGDDDGGGGSGGICC